MIRFFGILAMLWSLWWGICALDILWDARKGAGECLGLIVFGWLMFVVASLMWSFLRGAPSAKGSRSS